MDIKKIRNYQIFSVVLAFVLGTILHFTYKLSGENKIVAVFSSINESVWEHLKLLYFPMLLSTIIGLFYFRKGVPNFLCSKTIGIIVAMFFTVVFFFTYTGTLGRHIAVIDIASFFIAVLLGEFISYLLIINKFKCSNKIAIIVLIVLFASFIIFTFFTPNIGIFRDPVTGKYGITAVSWCSISSYYTIWWFYA